MSDEGKAVFLSYASQDAEAAKRICESLRQAGVEVWFDQSELVGGDAWDAKIRGQIKACALFVPVISAATQARREGYFRIEWKLAAQRTHAIAEGTPFLLPVVLDGISDGQALVPAEFRDVQWTRLKPDESPASFAARIRSVLSDAELQPVDDSAGGTAVPPARRPGWAFRWSKVVPLAVLVIALVFAFRPMWQSVLAVDPTPSAKPAAQKKGEATEENRLRALLNGPREDTALAEESTRRATEKNPESAQAWSAAAFVQAIYIIRGWDTGEKRRQETQTFARRALSIDPKDSRAFRALAIVLINQGAYQEAETMARRALAARPDDDASNGELASALSGQGKPEEAIVLLEESARRFPQNTGPHYTLGLLHVNKTEPDFEAALRHFQTALALRQEPPANINLHIAALLAGGRGDFGAARATLDQISALDRIEDRAVGTAMMLSLLERQPARVLTAGGLTARDYFEDLYVHGPKAWRLAQAYRLDRRDTLARQEWQRAEAVLRQRLTVNPANAVDNAALAATLAWLERGDEAATLIAPVEAAVRESPPRVIGFNPDHLRLLYLAYYYAGRADAARAVPYIRRLLNRRELLTDKTLPLDPWWDKIRDQSEFCALLSEAKARVAESAASVVSAVAEKSVAVLAFTNKSDDPANELFSDGLSEDLIGALGRLPGLTVTGWTSSLFLKNKNLPTAEIGKQLGVSYVVRGSVYKSGNNTVRITAQVSRAATDVLVWSSEPLERELKDSFKVRDEIAGLIAQALSLKLGTASPAGTATVNPEALRLYLEGRQMWNLRSAEGFARADLLFRRALELEPNFGRALSGLADVGVVRRSGTGKRLAPREEIVRQAERAIALDPSLADPHATLGLLEFMDWNFAAADRHFQRAFTINPSYAWAHLWRGQSLMTQGRVEEAMAENRRALEADPLAPRIASNTALLLLLTGRPADALASADRSLSLLPGEPQAQTWKAEALLMQGRADEALQLTREALAINPQRLDFTSVLASAGSPEERAAAVAAPDPRFANRTRSLLATGRVNEALAGLEADARDSVFGIQFVLYHPDFDTVRTDPRFAKMLEALRMTEAHDRAQAWRAANPPQERRAR